MGRVADQLLTYRVHDEIKDLERHLANQYRTFVGHFAHLAKTVSPLNRQLHRKVGVECDEARWSVRGASAVLRSPN